MPNDLFVLSDQLKSMGYNNVEEIVAAAYPEYPEKVIQKCLRCADCQPEEVLKEAASHDEEGTKLVVEILLKGDAIENEPHAELTEIFKWLYKYVKDSDDIFSDVDSIVEHARKKIMDSNGNSVGKLRVEVEESAKKETEVDDTLELEVEYKGHQIEVVTLGDDTYLASIDGEDDDEEIFDSVEDAVDAAKLKIDEIEEGFAQHEDMGESVGKMNQPDYKFYNVLPDNTIVSGWEFREDAKEGIENEPEKLRGKVYSKVFLKAKGIDPDDDKNWHGGKLTEDITKQVGDTIEIYGYNVVVMEKGGDFSYEIFDSADEKVASEDNFDNKNEAKHHARNAILKMEFDNWIDNGKVIAAVYHSGDLYGYVILTTKHLIEIDHCEPKFESEQEAMAAAKEVAADETTINESVEKAGDPNNDYDFDCGDFKVTIKYAGPDKKFKYEIRGYGDAELDDQKQEVILAEQDGFGDDTEAHQAAKEKCKDIK